MKFAVIVFPGSNCDHDAHYTAEHVFGQDAEFVWHKETSLKGADVVILPGGFSHGDYLRTGAIARFSPIMSRGGGFRAPRRAGPRDLQRLPGAARGRACCPARCCAIATSSFTASTSGCAPSRSTRRSPQRASRGQVLKLPIAHGEGNYFAEPAVINALESTGRVVFRYCDAAGTVTDASNPNGSLNSIAGICNEARNVVGLMPHPERACEAVLGSADGRVMFESVISALAGRACCAARDDSTRYEPHRFRCSRASRPQARRVRPHRSRA